jgi:pimeloyl-ACP methyl ester carboxylesterase
MTRQARRDDPAVYAHLATAIPTRAIVFVHGLAGSALQTWTRFPDLLAAQPQTADCDFIFYDYDSLGDQLGNMATHFMRFLRDLCKTPHKMVNDALPFYRPKTFRYEEVLIVAHSLGAVVTRRALLDAQGNNENWVAATRFMLFAPADCGANAVPLLSESLQGVPFGSLGSIGIQLAIPVLKALDPESDDLKKLLEHTIELTRDGKAKHLFAEKTLWASDESITKKAKFIVHEWADEIPGTTHTSVCKPSPGNATAVDYVLETLHRSS